MIAISVAIGSVSPVLLAWGYALAEGLKNHR